MKIWQFFERVVKNARGKDVPALKAQMESMSDREREILADIADILKDALMRVEALVEKRFDKFADALRRVAEESGQDAEVINLFITDLKAEVDKISAG